MVKIDLERGLFEGTFFLSEDLQLIQAFVPSTPTTPKKNPRPPAYYHTPSTTVSSAAASGKQSERGAQFHNHETELHCRSRIHAAYE